MKPLSFLFVVALAAQLAAQTPVDTSKIGPQVGTAAPAFSGPDQDGVTRSLAQAAGRKGTMLVFFRSADW
jgi:peroxiredoxin Q/BCP